MTNIITKLAEITGYSEPTVNNLIDALSGQVASALRSGEEVRIKRFLTFFPKDLPARQGRNPRTGESVPVAPSRRARARFSDAFVRAIQPDEGVEVEVDEEIPDIPPVPPELMAEEKPKTWYISRNGKAMPVSEPELDEVATPQTPVWSKETGWKKIEDIPTLSYLFSQPKAS